MGQVTMERMGVEALLVDDVIQKRDAFRNWKYNYFALNEFATPEAAAFGGQMEGKEKGIYMRFILPRSLRTKTEQGDFPLIPNRFLITRLAESEQDGKTSETFWVLEGDCPNSRKMKDQAGTPQWVKKSAACASEYLIPEAVAEAWKKTKDPYRMDPILTKASKGTGGYSVRLGLRFPAEEWEEKAPDVMFLRSCAPGNPMFSGYTGHNSNILSVYDDLEGVGDGKISYLVVGWYSDPSVGRYYGGQVRGIPWRLSGTGAGEYEDQLKGVAEHGNIRTAVGESPQDALRACLGKHYGKSMGQEELTELEWEVAAIQQHQKDMLARPGGIRELSDTIYKEGFESAGGGTRYRIVSGQETDPVLTEAEEKLLEQLNGFEKDLEKLQSMRQRCMELWWKRGRLKSLDDESISVKWEDFNEALDYGKPESLLRRTADLYERLRLLYHDMPVEGKYDGDEANIINYQRYGEEHGVEKGHLLQAIPNPRYWRSRNPYLLIKGVEMPKDMETGYEAEFIVPAGADRIPSLPGWSQRLPEDAVLLYGTLEKEYEEGPCNRWFQPWQPMFAEWRIGYEPHEQWENGLTEWQFQGSTYLPDFKTALKENKYYGGISMLDSGQNRVGMECFKDDEASEDEDAKLQMVKAEILSWKLLSQEFTNLNDMMAQRDYRVFRRPCRTQVEGCPFSLEEILGFEDSEAAFFHKAGGTVNCVPYIRGELVPEFHVFRCGVGHVSDLMLYDAFGRTLNIISSEPRSGLSLDENYQLIVPRSMKVLNEEVPNRFLLRPALLQYGRLVIRFFKQQRKNPVEGFLILNYLGNSLLVYQPDGILAGELALRVDQTGNPKTCFLPVPGSKVREPGDLPEELEGLKRFLEGMVDIGKDAGAFEKFLSLLDRSLWTMDSPGGEKDSVSVMAGRALALVNTELFVEPKGDFRRDIGWSDRGADMKLPEIYAKGTTPVRLGETQIRRDGVAGFFEEGDYSRFHSVLHEEDYVSVPFGEERRVAVTLLMDPYGTVHGYSGLFPPKEIDLPRRYTEEALKRMEAMFRVGPFLTEMTEQGIKIPRMLLRNGEWMWLERREQEWDVYPTEYVDQAAGLWAQAPAVREGILKYAWSKEDEEHGQ